MLPNFLCIGAQKSGTTWLHNMLAQHPQICMPHKKELFFFDMKENFEGLGRSGYETHFDHHDGEPAVGEITPAYLWTRRGHPDYEFDAYRERTPSRVRSLLGGNVKIIVLLRNPVRRAMSAFVHHIHRERISPDENILEAGTRHGILGMGLYQRNLAGWLETFDRDRFLIRSYDEVKNDRQQLLRDVYSFLGVAKDYVPAEQDKRYMKTRDYVVRDDGVYMPKNRFMKKQIVDRSDVDALKDLYAPEIQKARTAFGFQMVA